MHCQQRWAYIKARKKAERIEWRQSCDEAKEIARLFSERLSQLSFDYIRAVYMGDGERIRKRQLVKFDSVEIDQDQYRFHVDSERLPRGRGINEIAMIQDDVITALGLTIRKPVSYHLEEAIGLWYLVDRAHGIGNVPTYVTYSDIAHARPSTRDAGPLAIPIGLAAGRRPLFINLRKDVTAHFIVAGTTGSGKSSLLHTIVCWFLQMDPEVVKLALYDFKMTEFTPFYSSVPHLHQPIITEPNEFAASIDALHSLVRERYAKIKSRQCTNIVRYNAKVNQAEKMPFLVIVVDELGQVMEDPTVTKKKVLVSAMSRIASLGRACGVHMILSTQRPDANTLPGLVRQCCPGRAAYFCSSVDESRIIIGNGDACFKREMPAGRAILGHGRFRTEFQTAWISEAQRYALATAISTGEAQAIVQQKRKMMYHNVDVAELAQFALENLNGIFHQRGLYEQFRDRGVTLHDVTFISKQHRKIPFVIGDQQYILVPGKNRRDGTAIQLYTGDVNK